jgi:hypothetical protein
MLAPIADVWRENRSEKSVHIGWLCIRLHSHHTKARSETRGGVDAPPGAAYQTLAEAISFRWERFGFADLVPCLFSSSRKSVLSS